MDRWVELMTELIGRWVELMTDKQVGGYNSHNGQMGGAKDTDNQQVGVLNKENGQMGGVNDTDDKQVEGARNIYKMKWLIKTGISFA